MALPTSGFDGFGGVAPWDGGPWGGGHWGGHHWGGHHWGGHHWGGGHWGGGPGPDAFCPPGCHVVYGPVANVCHSAVPQVNLIPTTTVTPIPNAVYPAFGYGAPVPIDGPYPPFDGPVGYGGPPVSFYGSGYGPFGPTSVGGTGWAPGIYGSDVTVLGSV